MEWSRAWMNNNIFQKFPLNQKLSVKLYTGRATILLARKFLDVPLSFANLTGHCYVMFQPMIYTPPFQVGGAQLDSKIRKRRMC